MWLFVVEVKQCSCTSIKLHQVHSLTRNIPISNQSFGMGYRYIWPWGFKTYKNRESWFLPLNGTRRFDPQFGVDCCWFDILLSSKFHNVIHRQSYCIPRPSLSKAAVIHLLVGGERSLWLPIFDSRHKRLHVNITFLFYSQVLLLQVYRSTRLDLWH